MILKKEERTFRIYLDDMILAMKRIAEYVDGLILEDFIADYKTVDAVIRNFEIIGGLQKIFLIQSKINTKMYHGKKCII